MKYPSYKNFHEKTHQNREEYIEFIDLCILLRIDEEDTYKAIQKIKEIYTKIKLQES